MRIIGIDFGGKRTGLAVTDPFQIIATHLTAVATKDLAKYLVEYCKNEEVEGFVIGLPMKLNGTMNDIYKHIVLFKKELEKLFPDKYIAEIDERFTSKIAQKSILMSGVNKKTRQNKELVDMVSAVILLQDYMNLKNNQK